MNFQDYNSGLEVGGVSGIMLARGALIKPWIFTEIKEQRHWDIRSVQRESIIALPKPENYHKNKQRRRVEQVYISRRESTISLIKYQFYRLMKSL